MSVKAKICYKCNEYMIIHPELINPEELRKEKEFDFKHRGHPTQIVNYNEAKSYYNYEKKYRNK